MVTMCETPPSASYQLPAPAQDPAAVWLQPESDSIKSVCASSQKGDLKLYGPPSDQGTCDGPRTCNRRIPADVMADSLAREPPTPRILMVQALQNLNTNLLPFSTLFAFFCVF
ncbi:hypothetical protein PoB_006330900 [Plakobranchus ocellatus]|uniref:Uncharacterized protein n=1 Tax=Plakobranchus ocellatus TaxID=259542 RepID=A0AAV4CY01_9GAST|nr:hypothetical protein PoB_006330900 [Plakobranchus ocellatus]